MVLRKVQPRANGIVGRGPWSLAPRCWQGQGSQDTLCPLWLLLPHCTASAVTLR